MFVKDNKVQSIVNLYKSSLADLFKEREIEQIIQLMFSNVMGWDKITFRQNLQLGLSESELLKFNGILKRLKKQEPIQYILGETEFYGINFKVNSQVLIPRPETEELVDFIVQENKKKHQLSILDIGTGSGCIAIAIKKSIPNARVFAIDISEGALEIAKQNSELNKVEVEFILEDILSPKIITNKFDIIVSNPPYITPEEKSKMSSNVLNFEPHLALFVDDPMLFYRSILEYSKHLLNAGGKIYFELNEYFEEDYKSLFSRYTNTFEIINDIQSKKRMAKIIF